MASKKHLKDLLQEDQEPFKLKSFISDRKCQIKRGSSGRLDLQAKKRKPISQNLNFSSSFRKNACFLGFDKSPDPRKSPLFAFQSPCKNPNRIFINVPARTAAMLLEAAVRIQKQSSDNLKSKKGTGFGLLGSVLKKLTHRKKRDIDGNGVRVPVKEILRWDPPNGRKRFNGDVKGEEKKSKQGKIAFGKSAFETRSCNGEKSLEETSISSQSDGSDDSDEFIEKILDGGDLECHETQFCESPFHFVLQTTPSPERQTPDFSPPVQSPSRRVTENMEKLQEDEEEEDKEQCSPVSVLDPLFEDEDDDAMDDYDKERSSDIESGYAAVQRAKHQLLQKLCRFEKLAGLDLEKHMSDEEHEEHEKQSISEHEIANGEELVEQVLELNFRRLKQTIPGGMRRLVFDLIEENEQTCDFRRKHESAAKMVCGRLDSWEDVESNTIDMMVEEDYKDEMCIWKENQEEVHEAALQIEVAIFGVLVGELSEELVLD